MSDTLPNPALICDPCVRANGFRATISGVEELDCEGFDETCVDANGEFSFDWDGTGYVTTPTRYICGLYNWDLSHIENCRYQMTIGMSSRRWEGELNPSTGVVLLEDVGGSQPTDSCITPTQITLHRQD